MRPTMILVIAAAFAVLGAGQPPSPDLAGDWQGVLQAGAVRLRIVLHVTRPDGTTLHATLDSVDQGAMGIPVAAVTLDGHRVRLDVAAIRASYEGELQGDSIKGTWTQAGASLPLTFKRVKNPAELQPPRRPQDPVPPFPYRSEDVTYENPQAHIRLAGTLTIPSGAGPFPAAVLISGSGAQDRNETIFGHHPFLVLADYLTRRGIAVLRSDDRGVGESGGSMAGVTSADLATDTEAALAFLETRPEIDERRIGLIGHSEGGLIAPMVAARHHEVAFIVLWGAPGVPGADVLVDQVRRLLLAQGKTQAEADKAAADEQAIVNAVTRGVTPAALETMLQGKVPPGQVSANVKALESPWFRFFLSYDPAPTLERVRCPVLAITGSKDVQAPADQNLPAIRRALETGGNRHVTIDEMPGLNHLLQPATTGDVNEYAQIPVTIAPSALEAITTWIRTQVGLK